MPSPASAKTVRTAGEERVIQIDDDLLDAINKWTKGKGADV
ncbi:hypothetical protein [Pseudomonas sp. EL_65y_Pfl2_R95]